MGTVTHDDDFLKHLSLVSEGAKEVQFFVCNLAFPPTCKPVDMNWPEWNEVLHERRIHACTVVRALQAASSNCTLYGAQFDDMSFDGQGAHFNSILTKKGQAYALDLDCDIVSGCENCWSGHLLERSTADIGDAHFLIDPNKVNWRVIFSSIMGFSGLIPSMPRYACSKAAARNVLRAVKEDPDRVVVWYSSRWLIIYAGKNQLYSLIKSAMLYCSLGDHRGAIYELSTPRDELIKRAP